jgi:hypothetical protein
VSGGRGSDEAEECPSYERLQNIPARSSNRPPAPSTSFDELPNFWGTSLRHPRLGLDARTGRLHQFEQRVHVIYIHVQYLFITCETVESSIILMILSRGSMAVYLITPSQPAIVKSSQDHQGYQSSPCTGMVFHMLQISRFLS